MILSKKFRDYWFCFFTEKSTGIKAQATTEVIPANKSLTGKKRKMVKLNSSRFHFSFSYPTKK